MSRIGKLPVKIPSGVTIEVIGGVLTVKGPKGMLEKKLPKGLEFSISEGEAKIARKGEGDTLRALHGTFRALLANMVTGVTQGWVKNLELVGTGYRAETTGKNLTLNVGFSHPVKVDAPEGIGFRVEKSDVFIDGIDKELVGLVAANIRDIRPPEPYKGKGIKYKDEVVRRKAGKAAKAQGAA